MAEDKFRDFDWHCSESWKTYISNVYPPPSIDQVYRLKRKWFKQHIDPTLSLEPTVSQSVPSPSSPQILSSQFVPVALLFSLWPVFLWLNKGMQYSILCSSLGLLSTYGYPKRTKAYWLPVVRDDALHTLFFSLIYLYYSDRLVAHLPIALAAFIWVVGGLCTEELPAKVTNWARTVDRRKWVLIKQDIELGIGIYLVFAILLPWGSVIETVLYWQFLRIKYVLNPYLQVSFHNFTHLVDPILLGKPVIGSFWVKAKSFGANMVSTEKRQATACTVM